MPGGDARGRAHRPVDDEDRVALDRDGRVAALEVVAPAPVGRRAAAVEQAGGGEDERARAHRRDAARARREPRGRATTVSRRGVARARAAGDEQRVDRAADGLERPGRRDRVAGVRRDRRAAGRDDLDGVGRVVAARDGRGGGEDLGRPGDVERLDLGQGDDDDAAGHGGRSIARGGRGSKDELRTDPAIAAAPPAPGRSWPSHGQTPRAGASPGSR